MKVLALFLGFFIFDCSAEYHRLYRGFTTLGSDNFINTVNKDFFALFTQAVPEGLVTYRPMLLNEPGLPNEIVLLSFKDEEIYKSYTGSEIGKKIRAAHGPVFDSTRSNSLVPQLLEGKVEFETAYLLNQSFNNLAHSNVGVLVLYGPLGPETSILEKIEKAFVAGRGKNIIGLAAEGYVIEYIFADSSEALEQLKSIRLNAYRNIFKSNKFVNLQRHKIGEKSLQYDQGMDAQW